MDDETTSRDGWGFALLAAVVLGAWPLYELVRAVAGALLN